MSKTVMRVSKTVKRVMRVIMIGLVAMLGAKAEAHYLIIKGKLRYCSVCCAADFKAVPNPNSATGEFICEATAPQGTTVSLEILCPGTSTSIPTTVDGPIFIGVDKGSLVNWQKGKARAEAIIPVPDALRTPVDCNGDGVLETPEPEDVKILSIPLVEMCVGAALADSCSSSSPASTDTFENCTIPFGSPLGTEYEDCIQTQTITHIE